MSSRLMGTLGVMILRAIGHRTTMGRDKNGKRQYVTCRDCGNPSKTDPCFKCQQKRRGR